MQFLIQLWGGGFYLLNKIFFATAERCLTNRKRKWQIASWLVYLFGLPAWLIIFFFERNWIVFGVEAGGGISMLLGLIVAQKGLGNEQSWLDNFSKLAIILGVSFSLYDFGGINTINQGLEISTTIGFLFGTYMLARQRSVGYIWFILMNISMGILMFIENYPWLFLQQIISLVFVVDALRYSRNRMNEFSLRIRRF